MTVRTERYPHLTYNPARVEESKRQLEDERISDIARALGRMTVPQRERLFDLASYGTHALYPEVVTVQHLVNDVRRDRVKKNGGNYVEAFLNPEQVLRGIERYQARH